LFIWATVLVLSNFITGGYIFPLNILFTFMAIRHVIDRMAIKLFGSGEVMLYITCFLSVAFMPSMTISEYGTAALLLALVGYAVRNKDQLKVSPTVQKVFMVYAGLFFALTQMILFHQFNMLESKAVVFTVGIPLLALYFFKPLELVSLTHHTPWPLRLFIQFLGRYTLEIYVIHLILFKLAAATYGLVGYGWFEWIWLR